MKTHTSNPTCAADSCAPTKADELAILRDAVARLGPLSYCGPWLAEQLDGIARDLASDFFPQISRAATVAECAGILERATSQAAEIVARADREARALRDSALRDSERIRGELAQALHRAQSAVSNW